MSDAVVIAVFGDRKTGKSWHARNRILRNFATKGGLALYWTPNGPQTDPLEFGRDLSCDQVRVSTRLPYAVCLRGESIDDACAVAIDAAQKFRVALLVDEAHEVWHEGFSSSGAPGELFHRGRHLGVTLIVVSQWPARVDKRIFRAAERVCWFRLHAYEDLEWLRKRWGDRSAAEVESLKERQFIEVVADNLPPSWREPIVLDKPRPIRTNRK